MHMVTSFFQVYISKGQKTPNHDIISKETMGVSTARDQSATSLAFSKLQGKETLKTLQCWIQLGITFSSKIMPTQV